MEKATQRCASEETTEYNSQTVNPNIVSAGVSTSDKAAMDKARAQ